MQSALTSSLISFCCRSGTGIEILVITEIDRGTDIEMTMDIARAAGIDLEIDGDLGIVRL